MSRLQIHNQVQLIINELNLDSQAENKVKKCVAGYSIPDSFLRKICWVAYRIFNAIKSIFGQSDWQKARKALVNASISPDGEYKYPKHIEEQAASLTLKMLVELNENALKFPEEPSEMEKDKLHEVWGKIGRKYDELIESLYPNETSNELRE